MSKNTSLAKTNEVLPIRKLKEEDLRDGSIDTLTRAQALRTPQALAVSEALKSVDGRPLGDRILVLPLPPDERFGDIFIPDAYQAEQTCGVVVAVGKGSYQNGALVAPDVAAGNFVMFSKYAARKIRIGTVEVMQITEADITFAAGKTEAAK